jgi:Zn-dependent metalloprotease
MMVRYLRGLVVALALLTVPMLVFGLGEPLPNSALLTPELPFERGGVGEQQGTQIYNTATGRIESLFGMADGPYRSTPEVAGLEFLAKQTGITGYAPDELALIRSVESQGCRFVTYQAVVGGLPVYPGETVVSFDQQMRVVFLFNGLLPVDHAVSTAMSLSDSRAIQTARSYLKASGKDIVPPSARAVLWAGDDRPRPAWEVNLVAENPRGDWQLLVDGNSGEVFHVRNREKSYNGHGMAFTPDPLTTGNATYGSTGYSDNSDANSTQLQAQRFAVTLRDITFSGSLYRLTGPWVTISELTTPTSAPVTSSDSNGFSFTRDAQGFEDVMCYYHIDTSQRWIQSLGFSNIQHLSIPVDAHGGTDDNSYYTPSANTINYGEGGVDDAEDADVIWHEYGHAIQNSIVPNYGVSHDEGSMGEGFGDYWSGSYSKTISDFANTWVFNWDGHNTFWSGRVLNAGLNYSTSGSAEIHTAGQIWSQACYDTRNRANVGRTVMDKVVLQHHFGLGTTATMLTAAAAILTADNTLYGGIHYPDIYAGFVPRGLLSSSGAISCTSPNGGESWNAGSTQTISWSYYNLTGNVLIEINRSYSGGTWETINNTTALSAGSYSWTVTGPGTTAARIRVSPVSNAAINDVSNANFTIVSSGPSIGVSAPNGGETWLQGDVNSITWSSANLSENVKIELNRAYPGAAWEILTAGTANTGSYSWTVTGPNTTTARVRITGVTQTTVGDTSNTNFTIGTRGITVMAPNGGESWFVTDANNITWSSTNLSENVKIELNRAYPGAAWETLTASTANTGSYAWTVTGPVTAAARVRVSGVTHTAVADTSNANFAVAARSVLLTAPNGGETWFTAEPNAITWTSANLSENVKIELNRTYPSATWETLIASTANTGSYTWTVAGTLTSTARVRISGVTHTAVKDTSNANFAIATHSLSVTSPNGSESWYVGDVNNITWTSQNLPENVKIEMNRAYPGVTWEVIDANAANTGTYSWTVTGPLTAMARVRVSGVTMTSISDTSNANFTIAARSLTVTAPNGGESWAVGSMQSVQWTSANVPGTVNIELNRNYPAGSWESIATGLANSGSYGWTVTGPATTVARLRITSGSYPSVSDLSDGNFTVYTINQPPVIAHDPLYDQGQYPFSITAWVSDDAPGFVTTCFYRLAGAASYTPLPLAATGNANEYAVTVGPLATGLYEYYLLVTDAGALSVTLPVYTFWVSADCGGEQAFDDGTAERANWSENTGYKWAVRFDAPITPYVVCNARIGISAEHPDTLHSRILVELMLADGPSGMPGTLVASRLAGSIGNYVGGLPLTPDNWVTVYFRDGAGQMPVVNGAYYVVVSNPDSAGYEAFLQDTTGSLAGRSVIWNPCTTTWYQETVTDTTTRRGNRMIRSRGFSLVPPTALVVQFWGADMRLDWTDTGAAYYRIYSSSSASGPFGTYEGTATTNYFIDAGAASEGLKYYQVTASTQP